MCQILWRVGLRKWTWILMNFEIERSKKKRSLFSKHYLNKQTFSHLRPHKVHSICFKSYVQSNNLYDDERKERRSKEMLYEKISIDFVCALKNEKEFFGLVRQVYEKSFSEN